MLRALPICCYMRSDAPFKTMEDVRDAKEPPKCGATGIRHDRIHGAKAVGGDDRRKVQRDHRIQGRQRS